jgi:LysM repeat protein
VEKGETIAEIAAQYAVNTQDITGNNALSSGSKLKKGMSLRIPREALGTATVAESTTSSDSITGIPSTGEQISKSPASTASIDAKKSIQPVIPAQSTASNPQKNTTQNELIAKATPSIPSNPVKVTSPVAAEEQITSDEIVESNPSTSSQQKQSQISKKEISESNPTTSKKSGREHVKHIVRSGETLYTLAQKYGVRMTDLRNWNGISFDTDQLAEGQELIVSSTASPKLVYIQEQKHKSPAQSVKRGNKHTVKKGETLAQIADDYGVDIESLRKANNLKKSGIVNAGISLRIPKQTYSDERSSRAVSKKRTSASTLKVHSLKKGESLSKIAAMYNVSEKDLRSWNPGIKASKVVRGQKIKVYSKVSGKGSSSDSKSRSSSRIPKKYKVRKGDSMKSIANKFGISLSQLKKKNKKVKSGLKAGQSLRIQ